MTATPAIIKQYTTLYSLIIAFLFSIKWLKIFFFSSIFVLYLFIVSFVCMKLCLNIKKLKGDFKQKQRIRLLFKIGQQSQMETQLSLYRAGCYVFMEKHYIHIPHKQTVPFIEILIKTESGKLLSSITVFYVKFKQFTKIDLSNKNLQCVMHYELKEGYQTQCSPQQMETAQKTETPYEEMDRLKVFQFGLVVINFAQRIDCIMFLWKKIKYYFQWKNPTLTLLITLLLTLFIYYIKFSIFIAGTLLYFCKDIIIKKFERVHKYDVVKGRILFPQENAIFIQHLLHGYTKLYDSFTEIIFNPDKTFLINIIQLICKMGLLNILMLYLFDFQYIAIIVLWLSILSTSTVKQTISGYTKQLLFTLLAEYFKIVDKVSKKINTAIKKSFILPDNQHMREFYYYQYENWTVFQGWSKDKQTALNEGFQCITAAKTTAPNGWAWTTEWKIDYSDEVDEQGFQYQGKLGGTYSSSSSTLSTRRRRKWKRLCIQNPYR